MAKQTIQKSQSDRYRQSKSLLRLISLLVGLTGCSSASLVAQESFQMGANNSSSGGVSVEMRQFDCSGTDKVALQLLYIESGNSTAMWDGNHTRTAGSDPSSSCLLGLFFEEADSSQPFVDFSFSGLLTAASGSSKSIDRFDLSLDAAQPSPKKSFASWNIPPGTRITSGQPTLLQWHSVILSTALPEMDSSTDAASVILATEFSSAQDIVDFTRDREGSAFLAITIEPLN